MRVSFAENKKQVMLYEKRIGEGMQIGGLQMVEVKADRSNIDLGEATNLKVDLKFLVDVELEAGMEIFVPFD